VARVDLEWVFVEDIRIGGWWWVWYTADELAGVGKIVGKSVEGLHTVMCCGVENERYYMCYQQGSSVIC